MSEVSDAKVKPQGDFQDNLLQLMFCGCVYMPVCIHTYVSVHTSVKSSSAVNGELVSSNILYVPGLGARIILSVTV